MMTLTIKYCEANFVNIVTTTHARKQEAPLTLRGQRGHCGNIKGEPSNFGDVP